MNDCDDRLSVFGELAKHMFLKPQGNQGIQKHGVQVVARCDSLKKGLESEMGEKNDKEEKEEEEEEKRRS